MNSCNFVGSVHKILGAKKTNTGLEVCRFMIKTKEQKGETFVMIQAWRTLAETAKTLKENDLVSIEASYTTTSYEDKNGNKQYSHMFNAKKINILSVTVPNAKKEENILDIPYPF